MILQAEHALCFAAPELGTAGIAGIAIHTANIDQMLRGRRRSTAVAFRKEGNVLMLHAGSSPMASKRRFEGSPSCLTDYVSPTYSLSG
jgi:hypothetical protein